jgi:hypothetical protein
MSKNIHVSWIRHTLRPLGVIEEVLTSGHKPSTKRATTTRHRPHIDAWQRDPNPLCALVAAHDDAPAPCIIKTSGIAGLLETAGASFPLLIS